MSICISSCHNGQRLTLHRSIDLDQFWSATEPSAKHPEGQWTSSGRLPLLDPPSPTTTTTHIIMSDRMDCPFDGCSSIFTGKWAKSNLSRHRRQKHLGVERYACEDPSCTRTFARKDTRLKHHRTSHPALCVSPMEPRVPKESRDYEHVSPRSVCHVLVSPAARLPWHWTTGTKYRC